MLPWIICAVLFIVCVILAVKIYAMKKSISEICDDVTEILSKQTNMKISVTSKDKYVWRLATELSAELDELIAAGRDARAGEIRENELLAFNIGALVFDNHFGSERAVVNYSVASFAHAVEVELDFISHEGSRVGFLVNEKVNEMLTHPFFRSEGNKLVSQHVENLCCVTFLSNLHLIFWQVQFHLWILISIFANRKYKSLCSVPSFALGHSQTKALMGNRDRLQN